MTSLESLVARPVRHELLYRKVLGAALTPIAIGAFIITSFPLLVLGTYVWPQTDDFTHAVAVRQAGSVIAYVGQIYNAWSGRIFVELLNGEVFSYPSLHRVFALFPPIFFAVVPAAFAFSLRAIGVRMGFSTMLFLATFGLAVTWFGLARFLAECVFWLTGGIGYAVPLLLGAMWLGALFAVRVWTPLRIAGLVTSGFAIGFAHEQLCGALILAGVAYALLRKDRVAAGAVVPVAVAGLVMVLAPGNAARAGYGQHGLVLAPPSVLQSYLSIAPAVWARTLPAAIAGCVGGAVLALVFGPGFTSRNSLATWSAVMLAAAIGASLPLAAAPDFAVDDGRTGFFPAAFVVPAAAGLAFLVVNSRFGSNSRFRAAGALVATTVLAAYLATAWSQVSLARQVEPELATRWSQLAQASPSSDVVLPRLAAPGANVINTPELSADPTHWANVSTAMFFRVRSVRVTDH